MLNYNLSNNEKMRKIFFVTSFLPFVLIGAQQSININNVTGTQAVFESVSSGNGTALKYEEIQGSPYLSKVFQEAAVGEKYGKIDVRYNAYTDDMEFSNQGKVEVLPKQEDFYRVNIIPSKQNFVYFNSNVDPKGYFIELASGKNSIYKKNKVVFKDAVPAPNTYQPGRPATFLTQEPVYYLKKDLGHLIKISSLKKITELFPEKEDHYNKFIKDNKLKFNDADLVKLLNYINQ